MAKNIKIGINEIVYSIIIIGISVIFMHGCKKKDNVIPVGQIPTLWTDSVIDITRTNAISGGYIRSDGGNEITAKGVCWSIFQTPTTENHRTIVGIGPSYFSSPLTGLTANTTYYVRSYATNSIGTGYGDQKSFVTGKIPVYGSGVTDIDGNQYVTIIINDQEWMAENLKVTKYHNGNLIGTTSPPTLEIYNEYEPKYQWAYQGDENYLDVYGRLYTAYVIVDSRGVCPTGWHVPSKDDWIQLLDYLTANGHTGIEACALKSSIGWEDYGNGTDDYGFNAQPGGFRYSDGSFEAIEHIGTWWSTSPYGTNANCLFSIYDSYCYVHTSGRQMNFGSSVRCIRD
ncbi:MAG: FISUMP domain-containing protein [Bacteroidota bacterium]